MSEIQADEFVADHLDDIVVNARDDFYVHLITQEIPFWYRATLDNKPIEDDEVEWLIKRRGFNEEESASFRTIAKFFKDNGQRIRLLWARLDDDGQAPLA